MMGSRPGPPAFSKRASEAEFYRLRRRLRMERLKKRFRRATGTFLTIEQIAE